eukprot:TRINITY_DN11285_c1_g3_i1.p1 TRINITY_DN11285_c1_g3~~TRINITY_DN11285_c1_g3_i1.p1  ORF type:complete len:226 (-),score=37.19 TRINITY_DN11285_c1_g3_i1:938-1615(-)
MAGALCSLQLAALSQSAFTGQSLLPVTIPRGSSGLSRRSGPLPIAPQAKGFDLGFLLGGRGLEGGEKSTNTVEGKKLLFKDEVKEKVKKVKEKLTDLDGQEIGAFEKELLGLTGGFPGGEKGITEFIKKFGPKALEKAKATITGRSGVAAPPLFMPGMTVQVVNQRDAYYQYTGIVQRVTDGRAGVLFEGGNWDKLVTFDLKDLERSAKGPPASNPKSAVLKSSA